MRSLTLGSLFDGIGGWLIASKRNGIQPLWASEIEPFPISVTKKWHPEVEHLGDVTKLDGGQLPPVDIICAGSPCQDLSIAAGNNRKGLSGERSGLFRDAVRLFWQMRAATNGEKGRFFVWENVVGSLSTGSPKGGDFRAVLSEISKADIPMPGSGRWAGSGMVRSRFCDIAWRIIDAQYWGVAQRRRRIFLVADFGAPGDRRPEVLFESESLFWNPEKGRTTKESAPGKTENCTGTAICIRERCGCEGGVKDCSTEMVEVTRSQHQTTNGYGNHESYCIAGNIIDRSEHTGGNGNGFQPDISHTLNTGDRHAVYCGTLTPWDVQTERIVGANGPVPTIQAGCGGSKGLGHFDGNSPVRKLTPIECERLQGLPDGYTEGGSDAARYKAIGNGMAQPCADYIMAVVKRMAEE